MSNLRQTFDTFTRDDIATICDRIVSLIENEIKNRPLPPIVISLQSSDNAGKSAFWDIIRERLFVKGGIFINKQSMSSQERGRIYETWEGNIDNIRDDIRLLNCNVGALGYEYMGSFSIETLYSIIGCEKEEIAPYDIIILSKSNSSFIDPKLHSLNIDIRHLEKDYATNWIRQLECSAPIHSPLAPLLL